jgi:hypothetical protein
MMTSQGKPPGRTIGRISTCLWGAFAVALFLFEYLSSKYSVPLFLVGCIAGTLVAIQLNLSTAGTMVSIGVGGALGMACGIAIYLGSAGYQNRHR